MIIFTCEPHVFIMPLCAYYTHKVSGIYHVDTVNMVQEFPATSVHGRKLTSSSRGRSYHYVSEIKKLATKQWKCPSAAQTFQFFMRRGQNTWRTWPIPELYVRFNDYSIERSLSALPQPETANSFLKIPQYYKKKQPSPVSFAESDASVFNRVTSNCMFEWKTNFIDAKLKPYFTISCSGNPMILRILTALQPLLICLSTMCTICDWTGFPGQISHRHSGNKHISLRCRCSLCEVLNFVTIIFLV